MNLFRGDDVEVGPIECIGGSICSKASGFEVSVLFADDIFFISFLKKEKYLKRKKDS